MSKSRDAFRTISEVADWLDTPAHVLRFWESKFTQVKPVKRAGGRRYYRPADMELLGGIKKLLHDDGMTIKGVQKVLRERGVKHVASLSPNIDGAPAEVVEAPALAMDAPAETNVVSLHMEPSEADMAPQPELFDQMAATNGDAADEYTTPPPVEETQADSAHQDTDAEPESGEDVELEPLEEQQTAAVEDDQPSDAEVLEENDNPAAQDAEVEPDPVVDSPAPEPEVEDMALAMEAGEQDEAEPEPEMQEPAIEEPAVASSLPSFLRPRGMDEPKSIDEAPGSDAPAEATETTEEPVLASETTGQGEGETRSDEMDYGVDLTAEVVRGPLSNLFAIRKASASELRAIQSVVRKLQALHDRLAREQS